jgi:hypothetical protein
MSGIKTLWIVGAALAILGLAGGAAYQFVVVPRENQLAEYYVSSDPSGVLVMHLVQNNTTFSGTLEALLPITGANAQTGGAFGRLYDAKGHVTNGCGDMCAVDYSISLHGRLSGSNLALDISTAAGFFTQTVTCVFTVQGNSLTATANDPCGQQGISQDGPVTAQGAHLIASSAQGAADARSAFFRSLPATIKAWGLWNALQTLQQEQYASLSNGIVPEVNYALSFTDPCQRAQAYSNIGPDRDNTEKSIQGAAVTIKNDQALVDDFNSAAKSNNAVAWYAHNTQLVSGFQGQIQTATRDLQSAVDNSNAALNLARTNAPTAGQMTECYLADFWLEFVKQAIVDFAFAM